MLNTTFFWVPHHIQTCIWISDSSPGLHARAPRVRYWFLASATLEVFFFYETEMRFFAQGPIEGLK